MSPEDVARRLDEGDVLISTKTAAKLLCDDEPNAAYKWLAARRQEPNNDLPFVQLGSVIRYWRSDLIAYIAAHTYLSTLEYAK
ncbi:hypothetical protein [Bifidobacterium vansinderenii]|uniref:Uncharacterized protein n=1 Tax=Bifidobacterium vansinderenii TaxID=1984871 RepID=A0A229W186_9BIFI|nr:hypothetical protein [Bifidobacterium vansinderenii]OXN01624.1 hypothetical protein Tam10B_0066 [Bifidobacterium vansinderenii]